MSHHLLRQSLPNLIEEVSMSDEKRCLECFKRISLCSCSGRPQTKTEYKYEFSLNCNDERPSLLKWAVDINGDTRIKKVR